MLSENMQPQNKFMRAHETRSDGKVGRMERQQIIATLQNEKAPIDDKIRALASAYASLKEKEVENRYGDPGVEKSSPREVEEKLGELWREGIKYLADPDREVREFALRAVEDITCNARYLYQIYWGYWGVDYPPEIRQEAFAGFLRLARRIDDKSIPEGIRLQNLETLLDSISSVERRRDSLKMAFSVLGEVAGRDDVELTPHRRNVTEMVVRKLISIFTHDPYAGLYKKVNGKVDLTFDDAREANYARSYEDYGEVKEKYEAYLEIKNMINRLFNDLAETNKEFGEIFIKSFRQTFQYIAGKAHVNDRDIVPHDELLNIVAAVGINHSSLRKVALETLEMSLRAPRYFSRRSEDIEKEVREILSHIARLGGREALDRIAKEFGSEWGELKKVGEIAKEIATQTTTANLADSLEGLL